MLTKTPKNLALVSGALYSTHNYLIERHIAGLGNIHVASDEPGVSSNIASRVGSTVIAVPDFDVVTYDRDIAYARSAGLYKQFEHRSDQRDRSVRLVDLDLPTEKFKLNYLDSLSQVFAEIFHFYDAVSSVDWGRVVLYVDPHSPDFPSHFYNLKKKPETYTVINGALVQTRIFRTRAFHRQPTLTSELKREAKAAKRHRAVAAISAALSKYIVLVGGKAVQIPSFGTKQLRANADPEVHLSSSKEDLGIFQHVTTLLKNSNSLPRSVILIAETQSRPYAEALAIAMQYIPSDLNLVILATTRSAAVSRFFADALLKSAQDRLGKEDTDKVAREFAVMAADKLDVRTAEPYSVEAMAIIQRAFPNVQFYYVDIKGADSNFVNAEWVKQNKATEVAFVENTINLQMNEMPVNIPRLRQKAVALSRQAYNDMIAFDLFAKQLLDRLDGKIISLATYSGRLAISRIAAIEAKRRGIMVVDWQCTILGKTSVFPSIIADRVLAIFKNAAELYESYFGFDRSQIDIVGFPRFMRRMTQCERAPADEILNHNGIHDRSKLHIFASQPLALRMQESFLRGLADAAQSTGSTILVCAHPSQRANGQVKHLKRFVAELGASNLVYSDDFEATDLFVFAKSVIAYSSTFIFEVAHFGWPAILFDPLNEPHILDYENSTEIMHAKSSAALAECLRRAEEEAGDLLSHIDFKDEERRCADLIWNGLTRPLTNHVGNSVR